MATGKGSTRNTASGKTAHSSTATKDKGTKTKNNAGHKYGPQASAFIEEEMKEMKQGKLKSGSSGKTVRNPKQAIAIGLSEARKAGVKMPQAPRKAA